MFENLTSQLELVENFLWGYFGVPIVIFLGLYLTIKSQFFQFRNLPRVIKTFFGFLRFKSAGIGVHPLKAFFAAVGGCVGIGNIVGICTAVELGGPGALLWIWATATFGMIIKYSEVYLGFRHRVKNKEGGYNGGPMFFLTKAFNNRWIAPLACVLLCVYGVEVYQFSVVTSSISTNFGVNPYLVISVLLLLVIFAGSGGVQRVGSISSASLPIFVLVYVGMGLWVLFNHLSDLPEIFTLILSSAFTGHAAIGGFAGAGLMFAMSHGIRRSCYSGDIGVGYASVIHSESSVLVPEKQASLAIFDIFLDTFIVCTTSLFIILATEVWHQPIEAGLMVQVALSQYFPFMQIFMPIFIFMLGYNTINAYFCVGLKCASHLSERWGRPLYYLYAVVALLLFSFMGTNQAQMVMAIAGVSLLMINGAGIYKLRHEISFNLPKESTRLVEPAGPAESAEVIS